MKKLILVLLCFALLVFGSIGFSKIIEVPDAIAWMPLPIVGGSVPAAGGGTLLVGVLQGSFASQGDGQKDWAYVRHTDGDVAVATGDAATGYFYFPDGGTWFATACKMLIYDNSKNLIGTSDALSSFSRPGWHAFTFTSGPTITSSNTYYVGIICNDTFQMGYTGTTTWELAKDSTGTYASIPDPISESNIARDNIGAYVTD